MSEDYKKGVRDAIRLLDSSTSNGAAWLKYAAQRMREELLGEAPAEREAFWE